MAAALCARSDDWYQSRDHIFKNRWEGLFGENQGSPERELKSFVGNVKPYPTKNNVDLKVTYYVPNLGWRLLVRSPADLNSLHAVPEILSVLCGSARERAQLPIGKPSP